MGSLRVAPCLLVFALTAIAQSDRGAITGTINDPAGAAVPSAPIEARNVQTGAIYQVASTATGNYTLGELPAGTYELSVTVPGFKKYIRGNLAVEVAQTLRIDPVLEVGAPTESVTVNEAAPLLKTESGELSHTVSSDRVDDLPVGQIGAIRNVLTEAQLLPGVVYSPGNVRLNGAPTNTQNTRIEGQDATYGLGQIPGEKRFDGIAGQISVAGERRLDEHLYVGAKTCFEVRRDRQRMTDVWGKWSNAAIVLCLQPSAASGDYPAT